MKKILVIAMLFCGITTWATVQKTNESILFETDRYELTEEAKKEILKLFNGINIESEDFEISLSGHTDYRGSFAYNDQLAKKRTQAVKEFLQKLGVNHEVITTSSFGEYKPIKPNTDQEKMQANRRVELVLTRYNFNSTSELEKALVENTISKHVINPNEKSIIKGNHGATLVIEPNSFVDSAGNPIEEKVEIELTEAIKYEDFIGHNLTTVSGGEILESGGMIKVEATTVSGSKVELAENAAITAGIKAPEMNQEMELFTSNSGQNWDLEPNKLQTTFLPTIPTRPYLSYRLLELPIYKRNFGTEPKRPGGLGKPRTPEEPAWEDYETQLTWYNFPYHFILKVKAEKDYEKAMATYERRYGYYVKKMNRYRNTVKKRKKQRMQFEEAHAEWDQKCREDSLSFVSSPAYIARKNRNDSVVSKAIKRYSFLLEEYRAKKSELLEENLQKMEDLGVTTDEHNNLIDSYIATINTMSWINIDRFTKMQKSELRAVAVKDPDETHEKVFVVFKQRKSMLPMYKPNSDSFYHRDQFPKNEATAILAYKVKDGRAQVYYQEIENDKQEYAIQYQSYKFKELKKLLSDIQS